MFASIEADKIEELRVKSESGDTSALKKDADGWQLVEPLTSDAADAEVSGITSALSQLEIVRVVDEKPANLNDYGLASPRIEVDFKAAGDKDFRRLLIGQKSPTGGNLFAKRNAEERVFLIPAFQEQTFNRGTFDLRDKALLRFERDKVDHITIDAAGKTLELAKTGSDWRLARPIQAASDYAAVEGLIGRVLSAQMKSIVSENADAGGSQEVRPRQARRDDCSRPRERESRPAARRQGRRRIAVRDGRVEAARDDASTRRWPTSCAKARMTIAAKTSSRSAPTTRTAWRSPAAARPWRSKK